MNDWPRARYIAYAKERALNELEANGPHQGMTSLYSDLLYHPETKGDPIILLSFAEMLNGAYSTHDEVRRFIEGLN